MRLVVLNKVRENLSVAELEVLIHNKLWIIVCGKKHYSRQLKFELHNRAILMSMGRRA